MEHKPVRSKTVARLRGILVDASSRATFLSATGTVIAALMLGWMATSPSWSMGINWDTAGYASEIARGTGWARAPWNSHYGVGNVYWIAVHAANRLGWTALDGLRALNALALAASALTISVCARRMRVPPALSLMVAAVYLTAWGTLILVFTWEDNLLFHPPALAALAVCIFRAGDWRWRDSLYGGLLVGLSSLMSWQGAAFAIPVGYTAFVLPGRRSRWWQRLRDLVLVPVGLVLARFTWVCLYWITARELPFADLLRTAFERPVPSYLPKGLSNWIGLLGKWREILTHLGMGVTHEMGPGIRDAASIVPYLKLLGGCLLGLAFASWAATCLFHRRMGRPSKVLAAAFLGLTLASAVYLDFPADKYKRYDYLPMLASLGLAATIGHVARRKSNAGWSRHLVGPVLLGVVAGQVVVGYHWHRQWHLRLQTSIPPGRAGHGNQTWFAYFRSLRKANSSACSFVFAFDELAHADGNLEIVAALVSELPQPIVIGGPPSAHHWLRPLPLVSAAEVRAGLGNCHWVSPGARLELARAH